MGMPTFGRRTIYTDKPEITDDNVCDVVLKALSVHNKNKSEIKHLYDVYRGKQQILNREKLVRPEINNKCVLNHAYQIVSFNVSYLLSEPIMYVKRGTREVTDSIAVLNDYMHLESKSAKDKALADDFNICGVAYRMVLPTKNQQYLQDDESPFNVYTLDPERTFLIRYSGLDERTLAGCYTLTKSDNDGEHNIVCVYTDSKYYEIDIDKPNIGAAKILNSKPHSIGRVPIVEYINNHSRLGSFEVVETVLDAINTLQSNRLDGTEQTVQSLMVFKNCEYDQTNDNDLTKMRENGAVMIKSGTGVDAGIELLSPELNQEDQQVLLDSLYKSVLAITGMPAMASENTSDSSNNGAAFMRGGWYSADARAKDSEDLWKSSETEFLRIVVKICRDMGVFNISVSDIDMKFTRRNYEDILSKSQTLTNMLTAGIAPLYAIAQCGLFSDPTEVYEASIPYIKKWEYEDASAQDSADNEDNIDGRDADE